MPPPGWSRNTARLMRRLLQGIDRLQRLLDLPLAA
jgi:hypothetical protein